MKRSGTHRIKSGHPAEVNKKKRHLPLRQLFGRVPNRLVRLKPCLMMSPLAVSTYLESPEFQFDVVIFDEASQVLPWDAIGAVYRGCQLVVAGDQKQLPPSTFFDRMVNDDDDSDDERRPRVPSSIGGRLPVPSPPSSGERVRVRGPSGRETLNLVNATEWNRSP